MRIALLLVTVLFVSCAPKTRTISGEIFIVTNGRQAVKMAGTAIFVLPLDQTEDALHTQRIRDVANDMTVYEYLQALPKPIARTRADSEGKFSITVPAGEYALTAVEQRNVIEKDEFYQWVVKASDHITLSNDNLAGSGDSLLPSRFYSHQ
jgi:hypothetical protein